VRTAKLTAGGCLDPEVEKVPLSCCMLSYPIAKCSSHGFESHFGIHSWSTAVVAEWTSKMKRNSVRLEGQTVVEEVHQLTAGCTTP
jgi:hypothetical protein